MELEITQSARLASIKTLTQFEETYTLDHQSLNKLKGQERQQANEYVQGILRRRSYLDFLISQYSAVHVDEMKPLFKNILRLGIYDLLFMDSTPDYAALNEAVNLAKQEMSDKSGDLVNAVLRRVQRDISSLPKPRFEDRTALIATTFSHPEWLVKRWVDRFGEREAFQLMQANNKRPEYYLRVNGLKTRAEYFRLRLEKNGVEFEESSWLPGYFKIKTLSQAHSKGWMDKGLCQVQDISAGFACFILEPEPGENIYDLCAAPGTKTILLSELMDNEGSILAVDISADRISKIAENVTAYGADNVKVQRADATKDTFKPADAVLIDAPCSGTGVMAKRADLRWRRTRQQLEEYAEQQTALLDAAAKMVREGGRMVYSTCSLEPEENQHQVKQFLDNHPEFEAAELDEFLPDEVLSKDKKYYQTLPHIHGCDGHFGVLLRRVS